MEPKYIDRLKEIIDESFLSYMDAAGVSKEEINEDQLLKAKNAAYKNLEQALNEVSNPIFNIRRSRDSNRITEAFNRL